MDEAQLQLMVDLHRPNPRQGPGGEEEVRAALRLARLDRSRPLKIADIGCGTGASTIQLATELDTHITAVDIFPEFLDDLTRRAKEHGVADRITTLPRSMEDLPFSDGEFDVIWSEGAIYNMGFEAGISAWRRFLKPGGKLIVSEITWLRAERPAEIESFWKSEYPEIALASAKIGLLEQNGYCFEGYFVLPEYCWMEQYCRPLRNGFDAFLERQGHSDAAREIVEEHRAEIALYERYSDFFGYGMYVASVCEA